MLGKEGCRISTRARAHTSTHSSVRYLGFARYSMQTSNSGGLTAAPAISCPLQRFASRAPALPPSYSRPIRSAPDNRDNMLFDQQCNLVLCDLGSVVVRLGGGVKYFTHCIWLQTCERSEWGGKLEWAEQGGVGSCMTLLYFILQCIGSGLVVLLLLPFAYLSTVNKYRYLD